MEIEWTKIVAMAGRCGQTRNNHEKLEEALVEPELREQTNQTASACSSEDRVML